MIYLHVRWCTYQMPVAASMVSWNAVTMQAAILDVFTVTTPINEKDFGLFGILPNGGVSW